ncbi:hypothetical protein [Pontibacter amylolyticus]|uniref:Uncharacterized protein n=1 Tax=Pontibacter amylolyticus TaxID=1424080 RepID=A0ABQ1WDM3_9BACT|nr:hypothetical protein [Pontibacter amylolyticus]GGG26187.1 hypothetical protein GCM10011323_32290 [Pontibacter amylolyticus]
MIKLEAIELFKIGILSDFPFGTLRESVTAKLGEPDCVIENEESSMIRYDYIEFHFIHLNENVKKLDGIVIIPKHETDSPERISIDCDWFNSNLNYEQTMRNLTSIGINFKETVSEADKEEKVIKTSGNVSFLFFPDDHKICKAGKFVGIEEIENKHTIG